MLILFKIVVILLLVGVGLFLVNIFVDEIFGVVGFIFLDLWIYLYLFIDWVVFNMVFGVFIVVLVWLLIYLFWLLGG